MTAGQSSFKWTFEFSWPGDKEAQLVSYSYDLIRSGDGTRGAELFADCQIANEVVRVQRRDGNRLHSRKLIDTTKGDPFSPLEQFRALTGGGGSQNKVKLGEVKRLVQEAGRSFVFAQEFLQTAMDSRDREGLLILWELSMYGKAKLFVVTSRDIMHLSSDLLRLPHSADVDEAVCCGALNIPMDNPFVVSSQDLEVVQEALAQTSCLLECIVPGHWISMQIQEEMQGPDGTERCRAQLVAQHEGRSFSFRQESEGIKKLVAVLMQLARVYCSDQATLAVDELDAGVFEVLLGDLLETLAGEGEGQLIFTSHNLRPLEVLECENIVFTTADPNQRYRRVKGIRGSNNLRKVYIRDIFLQASQPKFYNNPNKDRIAMAFEEAGQYL